jgi:hypothetical protein
MLAALSSGANGGTAYGLFENSEEMALNLGLLVSVEDLMISTRLTGNT